MVEIRINDGGRVWEKTGDLAVTMVRESDGKSMVFKASGEMDTDGVWGLFVSAMVRYAEEMVDMSEGDEMIRRALMMDVARVIQSIENRGK